ARVKLVTPTYNPILPNVEEYDVNAWKKYNNDLYKNINQQRLPETIETVITAANKEHQHLYTTMFLLHINVVYEIWFWFVNEKWVAALFRNWLYHIFLKIEYREAQVLLKSKKLNN
ncbi:8738_t:CDS:2, partial [Gigaspora margarita]